MTAQLSNEDAPDLSPPSRQENLFFGVFLAAAGVLRMAEGIRHLPDGLFDDGYVTLHYAENLVHGFGLVFNPGERVLGTTSPLFAFLLAAVARIVGTNYLEAIALTTGILASLGTIYLCYVILSETALPLAVKWLFLSVLGFLPSIVVNSVSGMETPLVLFLMTLSLYLCIRNRMMALAIVGVLLFLSRIDTLIWLLALGTHIVLSRKERSIRELAAPTIMFLAGSGTWLVFTQLYYGSMVPQSLVGKAVSHGAFAFPDRGYLLQFLSAFVPAQFLGPLGLLVILLVFALMIPSSVALWRSCPNLRPIVYFFPLYLSVFLGSRAPLFSWYLIQPKWAFYLLSAYFLWFVMVRAGELAKLSLQPSVVLGLASIALVALGMRSARAEMRVSQPNGWLEISRMIEEQSQPNGRVFLEHIGLIGFHSGRYIYDSMGLVTPETTRLKREYGPNAWLTKATREYDADIVVLYQSDDPSMDSTTDVDAAWFRDRYRHVRDYALDDLVVSVYFKKDDPEIVNQAVLPAAVSVGKSR